MANKLKMRNDILEILRGDAQALLEHVTHLEGASASSGHLTLRRYYKSDDPARMKLREIIPQMQEVVQLLNRRTEHYGT